MTTWHPVIDLSQPIPIRVPVVVVPEPTVVETPTFESDEVLGGVLIAGTISLLAGGFLGWQACNWLTSQEFYTTWAKEILASVLPIRKIQLLSGIGGILVEMVAAVLGVSVPESE